MSLISTRFDTSGDGGCSAGAGCVAGDSVSALKRLDPLLGRQLLHGLELRGWQILKLRILQVACYLRRLQLAVQRGGTGAKLRLCAQSPALVAQRFTALAILQLQQLAARTV